MQKSIRSYKINGPDETPTIPPGPPNKGDTTLQPQPNTKAKTQSIFEHSKKYFETCQAINEEKKSIKEYENEFIHQCNVFTKKIKSLNNSPWQNIFRWINRDSSLRLGKTQRELIKYLYDEFFIYDQPCYVKNEYMALKLNCCKQQISRTLKSLEEHKLILKINWLFGRWNRTMILPCTPEISDLFNDSKIISKCLPVRLLPVNKLFRKFSKSLEVDRSIYLYTLIYYTNQINYCDTNINIIRSKLNFIISKEISPSFQERAIAGSFIQNDNATENALDNKIGFPDCRAKKETLSMGTIKRFALKCKNASKNIGHPEIADKLRSNKWKFDCLTVPEKNTIAEYLEFHTHMPFRNMYKIGPYIRTKSPHFAKWTEDAQSHFLQLFFEGIDFQFSYADDLISHWNAKAKEYEERFKIKKLRNIRKSESLLYYKSVVTITWCLYKTMGGLKNGPYDAIGRLTLIPPNKPPWAHRRDTLSIDLFLGNYSGTKVFYDILNAKDDKTFAVNHFAKNKETMKYLPVVEEAYLNTWKKKPNGIGYIKKNRQMIVEFIDSMITKLKRGDIETCGLKIFVNNPSINYPSLIESYISWLNNYAIKQSHMIPNGVVTIYDMVDPTNWRLFVNSVVHNELGFYEFWTNKKKTN